VLYKLTIHNYEQAYTKQGHLSTESKVDALCNGASRPTKDIIHFMACKKKWVPVMQSNLIINTRCSQPHHFPGERHNRGDLPPKEDVEGTGREISA